MADGGLAHAGRAHQQDDGAGDAAFHDAQGEKLEDALLDVLQAIVVLVQHLAGMLQVQLVFRVDAPGQQGDPVQVVAGDRIFGGTGFQDRQFVHLLLDPLFAPDR